MKIDDAVIDKVLNNKASAEDARQVSEWFATEEGHDYLSKRMDGEMLSLTEGEVENWVPHAIPEEKMKQRFLQQIKPRRRVNSYRRWWAAAVLIPFIFLCGSVWFLADKVGLFSETEYAELVVPCGEQMRVVLQDGTIVQLNSDTRLKYPKKFGIFTRTVELWGEGYFEVAKEKDRPFVVDLGDINVKVTGTKFNVKAYTAESNLWVTLDEGGVLLKDTKGKEYPLHPGESAEYNRRSGVCQISRPENMEQITSWRSKGLNFYLTPLKEIVKVLERQYDVHFIVPDSSLLDHRFTLSTNKVNVVDVLNDLEAVSHISFNETGKGIFEITEKE
ncbi:FecR domain-containing protein [uncultured Phocaeicola sp.]|jgi:ferric-dicitrate binding protein FerR (iron transport regulator)|uniref:FecR family protein n=1 Tax=uncultured Phocaeicola sp. TaxID=990718 RepID=UPI00258549DB|nr:FecR domain-containing protein [uncultured Phocaeicola sp.]